jgi:hypothetical protein
MPTLCGYFSILAKRPSRPLPSLTGSIPWPSARRQADCAGAPSADRLLHLCRDYVLVVSVFLRLAAPLIVELFHAQGETAGLITFVCAYGGVLWLFLGYLGLIVGSALFGIGVVIAAYIVTGRLAKRPKVL